MDLDLDVYFSMPIMKNVIHINWKTVDYDKYFIKHDDKVLMSGTKSTWKLVMKLGVAYDAGLSFDFHTSKYGKICL